MFGRIGRFSVKRPWLTIVAWILAAVAMGGLAPELKSSTNQADFLPSHYESVQVAKLQESAFPKQQTAAAIVVYQRADGAKLTAEDKALVTEVTASLNAKKYETFQTVVTSPEAVSKDGKMALASVMSAEDSFVDEATLDSVEDLRADGGKLLKGGALEMGVTGPAATALDAMESAGSTDSMILMATLLLIIVLLGAIFRSPLIALMPVLMISVMFMTAQSLIAIVTDVFGLETDGGVSAILIVVLFGVGTDYILFLLFRYRELLRAGQEPKSALAEAVSRVGGTIASAAGAVIVAFLALVLSSMGSMRAMGPALAISVFVTLVASLTLVPAVFSLLGAKAFWPSKAWKQTPKNRLANGVSNMISRRPALIAAASGGLLVVLALGTFGFKPEFDSQSSLPKDLESVQSMTDIQQSFPAGETEPSLVYVRTEDGVKLNKAGLDTLGQKLSAVDGVGSVSPPALNPKGDVAQYSVALDYRPASDEAIRLVSGGLRDAVHEGAPEGTEGMVGGQTAVLADIETAVNHDYKLVFPVAGIAIMVILGLLLRSVVAPLYLMISVGLGFSATLGSTVWLFQGLKGENGLLFMLPIIVYLFVVAIGTDYNILMVARLRDEVKQGKSPAEAARLAVAHSAPTIGSAAIILAGTFGVLMLAGNTMLQQMGFAVAFGILLTAFIMALLLVPTLTALLGAKAWWPHRIVTAPEPVAGPVASEESNETVKV